VSNISGLGKKDRHPLNIKRALSAKIINFCYPWKLSVKFKKKCIFQVTIFFLLNSRLFLTNKNIPHPPKVKWSNIEYSIKLFFFPREVRDKNKESSIYTQNFWIVDICLILLYASNLIDLTIILLVPSPGVSCRNVIIVFASLL
jgi:hypothetical protein